MSTATARSLTDFVGFKIKITLGHCHSCGISSLNGGRIVGCSSLEYHSTYK